jgi:hypothetical protein
MRNVPETRIIFLVYSQKKLFSSFLVAILIGISEINYIKQCTDRNYVHKQAYLGSDERHAGRKSKLKFWS